MASSVIVFTIAFLLYLIAPYPLLELRLRMDHLLIINRQLGLHFLSLHCIYSWCKGKANGFFIYGSLINTCQFKKWLVNRYFLFAFSLSTLFALSVDFHPLTELNPQWFRCNKISINALVTSRNNACANLKATPTPASSGNG